MVPHVPPMQTREPTKRPIKHTRCLAHACPMQTREPTKRPAMLELLEHPWIRRYGIQPRSGPMAVRRSATLSAAQMQARCFWLTGLTQGSLMFFVRIKCAIEEGEVEAGQTQADEESVGRMPILFVSWLCSSPCVPGVLALACKCAPPHKL